MAETALIWVSGRAWLDRSALDACLEYVAFEVQPSFLDRLGHSIGTIPGPPAKAPSEHSSIGGLSCELCLCFARGCPSSSNLACPVSPRHRRLISRKGKDLTYRFPVAVQAVAALPVNSCILDGEAIISDATGLAVFSLIRSYRNGPRATLCAFDLIEIDGEDLRWRPIEDRKGILKKPIGNKYPGIAFNKHFDVEGSVVFHHACKLGCEGIVSKRLGSSYRFGRSNDWIKVKNPAAPAVKREAEEDWSTLAKRLR